jgi:hypothetical protein
MSREALAANSIVEAYLCVLIRPCTVCQHGACEPSLPQRLDSEWVRIVGACQNCGANSAYDFLSGEPLRDIDPISDVQPLNSSGRPSRILDVGQWLTLAELMLRQADGSPDAQERLWRRHRAAECMDEALRLYPPGAELPGDQPSLTDSTRGALRDRPEKFLRERILARRAELPTLEAYQRVGREQNGRRRPWWKFW